RNVLYDLFLHQVHRKRFASHPNHLVRNTPMRLCISTSSVSRDSPLVYLSYRCVEMVLSECAAQPARLLPANATDWRFLPKFRANPKDSVVVCCHLESAVPINTQVALLIEKRGARLAPSQHHVNGY